MAENRNTDRYRSCWFYDNQMLDRMTSVSLHANTYLDNNRKWRKFEKGSEATGANMGVDAGGYCLAPLCTSILNEDFQVSISNTWNEVGGDPVSSIWDQLARPLAPYANYAKDVIKQIGDNTRKWGQENKDKVTNTTKQLTEWAGKIGDFTAKHGEDVVEYMNSVLISQGTRFSYYSGSGVSFGNLQMRFTMFPIWSSNGTFLTVPQQLELLFPYVMGTYTRLHLGVNEEGKANIHDGAKGGEEYSTLLGWQHPPAGYQAVYEDIDKSGIKGTLKHRIGSFYVLESLVCESMSFNLSRQMVKRPLSGENLDGPGFAGVTKLHSKTADTSAQIKEQLAFSPLFADIIMSFRPATKYSDATMRRFIYGLNINGDTNEGGVDASDMMKKNLQSEIKAIKSKYGDTKEDYSKWSTEEIMNTSSLNF